MIAAPLPIFQDEEIGGDQPCCPGVIPFDDIDERGRAMIAATPAERGGTPEEVAGAVV